jgi:hypothetical protein
MLHVKHRRVGNDRTLTRQRPRAATALAVLLLAACSSPEEIAAETGTAMPGTPATPASPAAPAPAAVRKVAFADNSAKGEATREFAYAWPAEVSAIPALAKRLTAERDQLLAEQKAEWEEALTELTADDCGACVNRSYEKTWDVVADLPRFLSLSAAWNVYSGGAHGNYAWDALVWDRKTGQALDPRAMFASPEALQAALGAPWCKALKAERTKRLGADYADDGIFACPPIADLTVLLGSSDRKAFNRIGLIAAPYVAGSYAEGEYELTFPVTAKLRAAVKPQYKAAFAQAK